LVSGRFVFITTVLCALALTPTAVRALETDQFTVPSQALVDLGPEFEHQAAAGIQEAVDLANRNYRELIEKAGRAKSETSRTRYLKEAEQCLTDRYMALRVYKALGADDGNGVERALSHVHVEHGQTHFYTPIDQSIYAGNPMNLGIALFTLAPTVNFHGVYLGTDKIGHLFGEGFGAYEMFNKWRDSGSTPAEALKKAVDKGMGQEHGIFGEAVDGCYSHADLAADYAGMKFYFNLTQPVTIGGRTYPPILVMRNSAWQFNPDSSEYFMRPFISDHLNESFNPCHYLGYVRGGVRSHIRDRGKAWAEFYHTNRDRELARMKEMETWFGEDYGHIADDPVNVVNAYFDLEATASARK